MTNNLRVLPGKATPDRVRNAAEALAAERQPDDQVTGVAIIVMRQGKSVLRSYDYDNSVQMLAELFSAAVDLSNGRTFE